MSHRTTPRRVDVLVASSIAFAAAACGSVSGASATHRASTTATPAPASGPMLTGMVTVTGAHSINSTFAARAAIGKGGNVTPAPSQSTCADYAHGFQAAGATGFDPPVLQTTGFYTFYLSATMYPGYNGPGTYDSAHATGLTGEAVIGTGSAVSPSYEDYHSPHGTTTLTVNPDGSGHLQFTDWLTSEVRGGLPGTTITGSVSRNCH